MVSGSRKESMQAAMRAGNFEIISGLSAKLGGNDDGPNPHEILEAALAACTILTGQLYANRKGYKLDSVDCVVKIVSEGAESVITREVSIRGELTAEEKARVLEILDKCPIHRLLESSIKINTTTV